MKRLALLASFSLCLAALAGGCLVDRAYEEYCRQNGSCVDAPGADGGSTLPDGGALPPDGGSLLPDGGDTDAGAWPDDGGVPRWGTPVPIPLNETNNHESGGLSPDKLTLCFGLPGGDAYTTVVHCATRANTNAEFNMVTAAPIGQVYYGLTDIEVVSAQEVLFSSGYYDSNFFHATLDGGAWSSEPIPTLISSNSMPPGPEVSLAGSSLYFDYYDESITMSQDLGRATWLGGTKFQVETAPGVNTVDVERRPAVAQKERFLIFKSDRDVDGGFETWHLVMREGSVWSKRHPVVIESVPPSDLRNIDRFVILDDDSLFFGAQPQGTSYRHYYLAPRIQ